MVFYCILAHNQYEWHDGSWDEPESISILDAIHVYGWDPHTGDMYSKSYTWISSQPVMMTGHLIWQGCSTLITMR